MRRRCRPAAQAKPTIGEIRSEAPTSSALLQFTPDPNPLPAMAELAIPTPRIAPIKVWELDAGISISRAGQEYMGTLGGIISLRDG